MAAESSNPLTTILNGLITPIRNAYDRSLVEWAGAYPSQLAETVRGPVEYAITGVRSEPNAPAVLIAHSSGGGHDQGVETARRFPGQQVIAVSRAGYLRTPTAVGETAADMADAYAALLDTLGIGSVVMVGWSAGGMSALEFAVRHPARCRGLILGAAITQPPPAFVLDALAPLALANRSDVLNWLFGSAVASALVPLRAADGDTRAILRALVMNHPASARRAGFLLDLAQMRRFRVPLDQVRAPTLLIHGTRDFLVPLSHAQQAAQTLPDAELLVIPGGQHDCPVQYPELTLPALMRFLRRIQATSAAPD